MAGPASAKRGKHPVRERITLDLDTLDKAEVFPDVPSELFRFRLGGRDYELRDPRDTDWKMALRLVRNPLLLMRTALVGADNPVQDPTDTEREAAVERLRMAADDTEDGDGDASSAADQVVVTLLDRFTAAEMYGWKLNALLDTWHQHYKIDLDDGKNALTTLLGTGG